MWIGSVLLESPFQFGREFVGNREIVRLFDDSVPDFRDEFQAFRNRE